jgi:enoyl-CoA hydratase
MSTTPVTLTREGAIALLTIDRPDAMNAINGAVLDGLSEALDALEAAGDCRGLILTGSGRAFVAGADIAAMKTMTPDDAAAFSARGSKLFRRLEQLPFVVVAAVNGFALGGGCELALACDFIYASEKARFGQPEVQLGLVAGFGGTQRLPRKVPYGIAMELLITGRMIDANEALRIGLVNRVCPPDGLLDDARAVLNEILAKGPVAVTVTRTLVQRSLDTSLDVGLTEETAAFGDIFGTSDRTEGVAAFLEKRAPEFGGS